MISSVTVAAVLGAAVCFVIGVTLSVAVVVAEYDEQTKRMPHGYRLVPFTDMLFVLLLALASVGLGLALVVEFVA